MEKTIIEIENTLSKINSRLEDAEEWISNLKDKLMESNQAERGGRGGAMENESRLRELRDPHKHNNICIMGIPGKRKKAESVSKEIIAEKFPDLGKATDNQIQEAQNSPTKSTQRGPHQDTC